MQITKTENEDSALAMAIELWGIRAQVGMVMEECGELLSALNQFDRNRITADKVAEEIADVTILMAQMAKVFGEDRVQAALNMKIERLMIRVFNKK